MDRNDEMFHFTPLICPDPGYFTKCLAAELEAASERHNPELEN